jgi:uncharacterized protein
MVYAVIDTNIFVSALITHNSNASTARVLESLFLHRIIPLYNDDIIKEYDEVLHRAKFKLSDDQICTVIELVKQNGIDSSRFPYAGEMPDEDDRVFYEVCLNGEWNALTANYCLNKDVNGGIRTHTELFAEFIKLCFLLVVHTDCHCCLCHKPNMFN